jgi:hypothetical protein
MHDPMTVAFEIRYPWLSEPPSKIWPKGYRRSFITIWHKDPERRGSDDSCGWFKRARHGEPETLRKLIAEFDHAWDAKHSGWFDAEGKPLYSPIAITLGMFRTAAWIHFDGRRQIDRFMNKHLYSILSFAENPVDSMHSSIVCKYGPVPRDRRVEEAASVVYGCLLRWDRPWWQHPRWHILHWHLCMIEIHVTRANDPSLSYWKRFWPLNCNFSVSRGRA